MIYIKKDLSTVSSGIIAHGVNCQGVMGSGVAKALRDKHPSIYPDYVRFLDTFNDPVDALGKVQYTVLEDSWTRTDETRLVVANCFTQVNYGRVPNTQYASYEAIESCIDHVVFHANLWQMDIYMPPIGCGLGGLKWELVEKIVKEIYEKYRINGFERNLYICDI